MTDPDLAPGYYRIGPCAIRVLGTSYRPMQRCPHSPQRPRQQKPPRTIPCHLALMAPINHAARGQN